MLSIDRERHLLAAAAPHLDHTPRITITILILIIIILIIIIIIIIIILILIIIILIIIIIIIILIIIIITVPKLDARTVQATSSPGWYICTSDEMNSA